MLCLLPLGAFIIEPLHHCQRKWLRLRIGVSFSQHPYTHFIQARIPERNRRITVIQKLVDLLSLFQPGQSSVLPQDRRHVRDRSQQTLMPAAQRLVAQFQAIVQDLPEPVHISFGRACHIHQIDGHHSLIESAVEFVAAVLVSLRILHRQERPTSHTGIYLSLLQFFHDLSGNIIRNHPLGRTLGSQFCQIPIGGLCRHIILIQHIDQLGEGRRDPHAFLILYSLHPLDQYFLDDHGKVISDPSFFHFIQIHEYRHERRLSITGH